MVFDDVKLANLSAMASDLAPARGALPDKTVYHARVLDFQGGKAMLDVEGRIVSADSEVPLKINSEFDLVVRGGTQDGKVSLQILGARETDSATVRPLTDAMISSRLIGFDLPDHTAAVPAARSLLNYGVAVTKENMESMLAALPKTATRQTIDFAASILREELPLTREIINLVPQLRRELEMFPETMKAVAGKVSEPAIPESRTQQEQVVETAVRNVPPEPGRPADYPTDPIREQSLKPARFSFEQARLLAALPADDKAAVLSRLPLFVQQFIHSTEARLGALDLAAPAQVPAAAEQADLVNRLISLIKIIPDSAGQEAETTRKAADSLLAGIKTAPLSDVHLENIRTEFIRAASASMGNADLPQAEKLIAVRAAAIQALHQALESRPQVSVLPPEEGTSLFNRMLYVLSESAGDTVNRFSLLSRMFADAQVSPEALRNEILTILSRLSVLQSFRFDADNLPELKQFIETAARWAENSADILALKGAREGETAREATARIAADPENAVLLEKLRDMAQSLSLRRELELIQKNFSDLPDLRMLLARAPESTGVTPQAAAALSRGLQYAGLANLAGHDGSFRMDAFVTYFPIRIGDRVEMGKLKIFRREDDLNRRKQGLKPLNPYDAKMVLILDTEFLGLSTISFQTFRDKSIAIDIEVQDKRRRNLVEKYSEELEEGLKTTSYEQTKVAVRVRKRKEKEETKAENGGSGFTTVDFRI